MSVHISIWTVPCGMCARGLLLSRQREMGERWSQVLMSSCGLVPQPTVDKTTRDILRTVVLQFTSCSLPISLIPACTRGHFCQHGLWHEWLILSITLSGMQSLSYIKCHRSNDGLANLCQRKGPPITVAVTLIATWKRSLENCDPWATLLYIKYYWCNLSVELMCITEKKVWNITNDTPPPRKQTTRGV